MCESALMRSPPLPRCTYITSGFDSVFVLLMISLSEGDEAGELNIIRPSVLCLCLYCAAWITSCFATQNWVNEAALHDQLLQQQ